jgi:hypothetical protein
MDSKSTIALIGKARPSHQILQTGLSEETLERFIAISKSLNDFNDDEEKLAMLHEAAMSVESMIAELTLIRDQPLKSHKHTELLRKLNREVEEFLHAFKIYLDHTELRLKHAYGETSTQFRAFKAATGIEFDNNFSYRFCYGLRNYLHTAKPISRFSESQNIFDGKLVCQTTIGFNVNDLLVWEKWHSLVKDDFAARGDFFPAAGIFNSAVESMNRIHQATFETEREALVSEAQEMKTMVQEALDKELFPAMGIIPWGLKENEEGKMTLHDAPLKIMDRLEVIKVKIVGD